jgi:hypothetical protein
VSRVFASSSHNVSVSGPFTLSRLDGERGSGRSGDSTERGAALLQLKSRKRSRLADQGI